MQSWTSLASELPRRELKYAGEAHKLMQTQTGGWAYIFCSRRGIGHAVRGAFCACLLQSDFDSMTVFQLNWQAWHLLAMPSNQSAKQAVVHAGIDFALYRCWPCGIRSHSMTVAPSTLAPLPPTSLAASGDVNANPLTLKHFFSRCPQASAPYYLKRLLL